MDEAMIMSNNMKVRGQGRRDLLCVMFEPSLSSLGIQLQVKSIVG